MQCALCQLWQQGGRLHLKGIRKMASSLLCVQQTFFLVPGSFNGACVDTPSNLSPFNQCYAHRSAKHGVRRAALAAEPSTEGSAERNLEELWREARMRRGRAAMRAW